jgi:hypothetical protein
VKIAWDTPILEGYQHRFLKNISHRPNHSRFLGCINPEVGSVLQRGRYDALWVHGWASATCWLGFMAAGHHRVPLLLRGETNGLTERHGVSGSARRFLLGRVFK